MDILSIYIFVSFFPFFFCMGFVFESAKNLGEKNGTKFPSNDGVGFRFHLSGKLNVSGKFCRIFFL